MVKPPASLVNTSRETPVPVFVTVIVTPGSTAFVWSVTVPTICPVKPCAPAAVVIARHNTSTNKADLQSFMTSPRQGNSDGGGPYRVADGCLSLGRTVQRKVKTFNVQTWMRFIDNSISSAFCGRNDALACSVRCRKPQTGSGQLGTRSRMSGSLDESIACAVICSDDSRNGL